MFNSNVTKVGGIKVLLKCNFDTKTLNCHIPQFYADMLNAWATINGINDPKSGNDVCKQVIWNNKYILIDNKTVFYKKNT